MAGVDFCLTTAFELKSLFKKLMQKSNVLFAGCAALLNLLDALKKTTEQFFQLRTGSHIGGAVMACGCQGVSDED